MCECKAGKKSLVVSLCSLRFLCVYDRGVCTSNILHVRCARDGIGKNFAFYVLFNRHGIVRIFMFMFYFHRRGKMACVCDSKFRFNWFPLTSTSGNQGINSEATANDSISQAPLVTSLASAAFLDEERFSYASKFIISRLI